MADFNETGISPIQSGASVKSPITVPSTQTREGAPLAGALSGFENLAKIGIQYMETQQKKDNAVAVTEYSTKLSSIADAVDQGVLSSAQAQTKLRALHQQYSVAHPTLIGDITEITQKFVNTAGLGKTIAEGTSQEKARLRVEEEAIKNGFVPPTILGDTRLAPEARQKIIDQGVKDYSEFKRHTEELQQSTAELNNLRANIGLSKDKVELQNAKISQQTSLINLDMKRQEANATKALHGMAASFGSTFNTFTGDIVSKVKAGQIKQEDAIAMINAKFADVHSVESQVGFMAGSDKVSAAMAPLKSMRETAIDVISGKISSEVYENRAKTELAKAKANMLLDPEVAKIAAASSLLDAPTISNIVGSAKMAKMFANNSTPGGRIDDPHPKTPEEAQGVKNYLNGLLSNMEKANKGDAKLDGELNTHVNNTLKGAVVYSAAVDNPAEFNAVADFLASPKFREYIKAGGKVDAGTIEKLKTVMEQQYDRAVIPLIQKKFNDTGIAIEPLGGYAGQADEATSPTSANIKVQFIGGGVKFVADAKGKGVDPKDAQRKADDLNREVGPTLNRLVRMSATLSGSDDKAVWEDYYKPMLFPEPKQEAGKSEGPLAQ